MGNYIDYDYIIKRADSTELSEVLSTTDLENSPVLLQSIIDAEDFVNESLESIYTVPLTSPSSTIKRVSYFLAIYYMYSYRYQSEVPENIVNDYKWALKYLKDVEEQKKKIVDQTETSTSSTVINVNKDSDDKYFDSDKLAQIL